VIADQVHALETGHPALERLPNQQFDDARGIRPTVHIVADVDHLDALGLGLGGVRFDGLVHLLQQVEPAVDVAHGVNQAAVGDPRCLGRSKVAARRHESHGTPSSP
jgi:hypothetical protein